MKHVPCSAAGIDAGGFRRPAMAFLLLILLAGPVRALVNPSLQPGDLFKRFQNVLICKIVSIDDTKRSCQGNH